MKKVFVLITIFISLTSFSQGFIKGIDAEDLGLILGRPCVISLASGEPPKLIIFEFDSVFYSIDIKIIKWPITKN